MKVEYLGKEAGFGYRIAHINCNDSKEVDKALNILQHTSYIASYINDDSVGVKVEDRYDYDTFMSEWKNTKKTIRGNN